MDLTPTNAEREIAQSVAEYLTAEISLPKLRQRVGGGGPLIDTDTWRQWASMGFFSIGVPEDAGGVGLGVVGEFLIFKEFGRHLTPGPLISTALAVAVADQAGQRSLTKRLMDGAERVGLRTGSTGFDIPTGGLALSANADGAALEAVTRTHPVPGIDPMVEISYAEPGEVVARIAGPDLQTRYWLLSAAVLLGLAEAAEGQSTAYAKIRQQFGKPIGSFQAVKHRCADMLTRCYVADSQLRFAVLSVAEGRPDGRLQAAAALTLCIDAARANTATNIQNHGGIGFTAEHDAGLYLKRALIVQESLGPSASWTEVLLASERTVFA